MHRATPRLKPCPAIDAEFALRCHEHYMAGGNRFDVFERERKTGALAGLDEITNAVTEVRVQFRQKGGVIQRENFLRG